VLAGSGRRYASLNSTRDERRADAPSEGKAYYNNVEHRKGARFYYRTIVNYSKKLGKRSSDRTNFDSFYMIFEV
jgi:hypothetical protein